MHGSSCSIFLLAALILDSAAAQGTGSISGDASRGTPGLNRGGFNPAARSGSSWPLMISGDVRTSSGEAPSEPVSIKRLCGAEIFVEGYSGRKGRFSFPVEGNASTFNGMRSNVGPGVDLSDCRLVADLPGYRSSSIQLGRRRFVDRPGVGTLILTPLGRSEAALVSATSLTAPKPAQKAFKKALDELNKGQAAELPSAVALLEKAVAEYPAYAAAWTILGETKQRMGDRPGAADAFGRAMEADPDYLRPYIPLATISVARGTWERAVELTARALNLDPSNAILLWLNAVSQFELGRQNEALAALDEVENDELGSKQFPQTHRIRGLIYARQGHFAEAAAELRRFLEAAPDSGAAEKTEKQLNEWRTLGLDLDAAQVERPAPETPGAGL